MEHNSLETIDLELTILIRRVTSMITSKDIGSLDRSAYLLLYRITSNGPARIKTLSDELHLDISTVSRQTAALEQKGYIFKIHDPLDKRAYYLQVTDAGTKEFLAYKSARLAKIEDILKDWTDNERELFGKLLRKYNDSIFAVPVIINKNSLN